MPKVTYKSDRLPHKTRKLSANKPIHVVMTLQSGLPRLWHFRRVFDRLLCVVRRRYGVSFSGSVLMKDHLHMVMQLRSGVRDTGLISRAIQYVSSRMAREINRFAGRTGTVFRDRFFSRVLRTASELLQALKYIGLNPVRARYVRRIEDWHASSIGSLLRGEGPRPYQGFDGWMYRVLGFAADIRQAMTDIVTGQRRPIKPGVGRQLRLPFRRGLPKHPRTGVA